MCRCISFYLQRSDVAGALTDVDCAALLSEWTLLLVTLCVSSQRLPLHSSSESLQIMLHTSLAQLAGLAVELCHKMPQYLSSFLQLLVSNLTAHRSVSLPQPHEDVDLDNAADAAAHEWVRLLCLCFFPSS